MGEANQGVQGTDILSLLLLHHQVMRETFGTLADPHASDEEKRVDLFVLLETLKIHTISEGETLYSAMEELGSLRLQALVAEDEHDILDRLVSELETLQYQQSWHERIQAKSLALIHMLIQHMAVEESETFPLVRETFTADELEGLGTEYLHRFRLRLDKVSALYEGTRFLDNMRARIKAVVESLPTTLDRAGMDRAG